MGKIDELIQQYCPDGVEYVRLGDCIKSLNTGLNPRQFFKLNTDDATNYYITIRELQNNTIVVNDKTDRLNDEALRLCNNRSNLEKGDVLFSGTGTIGEVAVIENTPTNWNIKEGVYAIKPDPSFINYKFLMYLLQSTTIRKEYLKKAEGGTVKSVSMGEMRKLEIPLPPLPVQKEIVRILDNFTNLAAELQAELQARQQQYQYYRDTLLSFDGRDDVQWKKLGEVAKVCRGTRVVKSQLSNEGYPVYQNCLTPMGYFDKTNCPGGTPFVICGGAAGNVGYADVDCWAADDCEYIIAGEGICSRYIYHCLMVKKEYLTSKVRKASIPRLSPSVIKELEIPIPPLSEQQHIVNILDRFDTLTNDLSKGLPAEIEARRQQYEYYRNRLLTFQRK